MSKCTKGLLIAALCVLTTWLGLSCLYTYSVSEELTTLRRESRTNAVFLRCRIRELESELSADLLGGRLPPAEAVGGEADDPEGSENQAKNGTAAEADPETAPSDTEAVTLPTHQSPETQPPASPETDAPVSLYLIAEQDGIIGLFDAAGERLRSVNVFVMTLPQADREALSVGIPAYSWSEALDILERYE